MATKKTTKADTAKKTASKVATALVEETYFEFDGFQVSANEINERIKEAYKAEGHRVSSIIFKYRPFHLIYFYTLLFEIFHAAYLSI